MADYDFTVVLKNSPELTEDLADKLFAGGCNDGTPGTCGGQTMIDFHRAANSLEEAIRSAIEDVNSAGGIAAHVKIDAEQLKLTS